MPRAPLLALLAALAIAPFAPASAETKVPAESAEAVQFMQRFSGQWRGTGRVLIGSQSGFQFHCELQGSPSRTQMTFAMKGKCWAGKLSAPVHARVRYNAETDRYYGAFMGGAKEDGADVVGERTGEGFFMKLSRGTAQGRVTAEPVGDGQMRVVISLHDRANQRDIPVVAMGFARNGVDSLPPFDPPVTGSLGRPKR